MAGSHLPMIAERPTVAGMDDSELRPVGRTSYRPPTAPPAMRPRRRATSPGTGAGATAGPEPSVEPAPDTEWADRPASDDDARYLADRPPHWGSD